MADRTIRTTPEQLPAVSRSIVATISDALGDTKKLRHDYALELLRQAQRNATRRPTPQARMTASVMRVPRDKGAVLGFPGTRVTSFGVSKPMGGFSFGSEFGSDTHRQFGPRNEGGYWLTPSLEQVDDTAGERFLDNVLNRVINDPVRGIR